MISCKQHTPELKTKLRSNKLRATPARLTLLDIFEHNKKPLSVNDLTQKLPGVDKVTVYRNVESLENLGLLKKIHLNDRQAYYELANGNHHHHIVCTRCGTVSDISQCKTTIQDKNILKIAGFAKITNHSLEFFGICKECIKKQ